MLDFVKTRIMKSAKLLRETTKTIDISHTFLLLNAMKGSMIYFLTPLITTSEITFEELTDVVWMAIRAALDIPDYVDNAMIRALMPAEDPVYW